MTKIHKSESERQLLNFFSKYYESEETDLSKRTCGSWPHMNYIHFMLLHGSIEERRREKKVRERKTNGGIMSTEGKYDYFDGFQKEVINCYFSPLVILHTVAL